MLRQMVKKKEQEKAVIYIHPRCVCVGGGRYASSAGTTPTLLLVMSGGIKISSNIPKVELQ